MVIGRGILEKWPVETGFPLTIDPSIGQIVSLGIATTSIQTACQIEINVEQKIGGNNVIIYEKYS